MFNETSRGLYCIIENTMLKNSTESLKNNMVVSELKPANLVKYLSLFKQLQEYLNLSTVENAVAFYDLLSDTIQYEELHNLQSIRSQTPRNKPTPTTSIKIKNFL